MNVTSANIRKWSMLGQRGAIFGAAFPELGESVDNLKLVTADLSLLSGMDRFIQKYPEKFLNVGIAEQNMIGISAGLAMSGYNVFATTYASFIAVRSLEFVRQHLSYLGCNVKIIGSSAGVVAAKSGVSHWATEDIAFTRVLPNMQVFSPADSLEAIKIIEYAAKTEGPMYIRLSGGLNCPIVYKEDYDFIPGKLTFLGSQALDESKRPVKKVSIIATGLEVNFALEAAEMLAKDGINAEVVNIHTIKPIDRELILKTAEKTGLVVTVEEHSIYGGLGSAVAEVLSEEMPTVVKRIGVNDTFGESGPAVELLHKYKLDGEGVYQQIREFLNQE